MYLKYIVLYVILFFGLILLVPQAGYGPDVYLWTEWATGIFTYGLSNVYHKVGSNDYTPLYQYILFVYGKVAGSVDNISHYRHLLKTVTLLFDFLGAILAASLVGANHHQRFLLSLLLLFNLGYLYNTLAWEQIDSIFTCLAFIAVLLAIRHQPIGSVCFYVLSFNTKPQAIIFLPALLMLWIPQWIGSLKIFALTLAAATFLQVLIVVPFVWGGDQNDLGRILKIVFGAMDRYPKISMNAFNIWFILLPHHDLISISDSNTFFVFTYKQWGLLLFALTYIIILFPLCISILWGALTKQYVKKDQMPLVLLSFGLIPVVFSYFNTQMHERYWHAAILFLAAYTFLTREYIILIVVSLAYFLNMEAILRFLNLKSYGIIIFQPRFVALLFGVVILLGVWKLYQQSNLKKQWILIRHNRKPLEL